MTEQTHAADLRTLVEFNADGLLIVDGEGRVRFGNPAAARLFGRPLEELVGAELGLPLLDGDTAEIDIVPRGGPPATVELRARPVQWDGTGAYVVTLRDVTERRRTEELERGRIRADAARQEAERAARRAEFLALASGVLNATLDVQTVLDQLAGLAVPTLAEFSLVHWRGDGGEAAQTASVHGQDAAQRILDALPPLDAEGGGAVARVLRSGRAEWHPGGPAPVDPDPTGGFLETLRPTAWMVVPLSVRGRVLGALTLCRTEPGARYPESEVGLAEELARRGALAAENARLFRAAQAASRAKSQFLATVSHEIRTPINAVMGYAELLEMGLGGPLAEKQAEYVGRIQGSSRHLLSLVNDVLDLSKIEAGEMAVRAEALPLRATADRALEQVEPQACAKAIDLSLQWSCPEDDVYVGDEDRVSQVLVNLLSNAVKFTEPGGSVTMTCSAGAAGPPTARDVDDRVWVAVEVADTGIGIPPDKLEAVFEPFMQVDGSHTRREGGTGLGLAISRRLARLMGGELTLDSTPGQGSRFTLWLPTTGARDGTAEPRAASSPWPAEPRAIAGLGALGRRLAEVADEVVARFAQRLRVELDVPGIERMSRVQVEDHLATYLMDLAQMMVTLDEEGGDPALLRDGEHIQRLLSWKHADQRLRLGWSAGQMRLEHAILLEEVESALHDAVLGDGEQAREVLRRLLADGEAVSLSRFARSG